MLHSVGVTDKSLLSDRPVGDRKVKSVRPDDALNISVRLFHCGWNHFFQRLDLGVVDGKELSCTLESLQSSRGDFAAPVFSRAHTAGFSRVLMTGCPRAVPLTCAMSQFTWASPGRYVSSMSTMPVLDTEQTLAAHL